MNEEDLKRCDELMGCRDHWQLNTEDFNKNNLYALADEVPGLVEEVRRLNLQVEELREFAFKRTVAILVGVSEEGRSRVRLLRHVVDHLDYSKYEIVEYQSDRQDEYIIEAREKKAIEKPKGAEGVCPLCYSNYNAPAGKCPDHAIKRKEGS